MVGEGGEAPQPGLLPSASNEGPGANSPQMSDFNVDIPWLGDAGFENPNQNNIGWDRLLSSVPLAHCGTNSYGPPFYDSLAVSDPGQQTLGPIQGQTTETFVPRQELPVESFLGEYHQQQTFPIQGPGHPSNVALLPLPGPSQQMPTLGGSFLDQGCDKNLIGEYVPQDSHAYKPLDSANASQHSSLGQASYSRSDSRNSGTRMTYVETLLRSFISDAKCHNDIDHILKEDKVAVPVKDKSKKSQAYEVIMSKKRKAGQLEEVVPLIKRPGRRQLIDIDENMPAGPERQRLEKINNERAEMDKAEDRKRNNDSAKAGRQKRNNALIIQLEQVAHARAERNFWRARAFGLGAGKNEWADMPEDEKEDMIADFRQDVNELLRKHRQPVKDARDG